MKKILLTTLLAALLLLPFGSLALTAPEVAGPSVQDFREEHLPGRIPAQEEMTQAMSPALHAVVLAMMHQDADRFLPDNSELAWESLYNLLSLYGQLDRRSQWEGDVLLLPEETAWDYAAALSLDPSQMGGMPASILDRLGYNNVSRCYEVTPGEDGLSQIEVRAVQSAADGIQFTGALVYLPEGRDLVRFQATLQSQNNMFGCSITQLVLTD